MSIGTTLIKAGLTSAILGAVILTARAYHRQKLASARRDEPQQLPPPPGPTPIPGEFCSSRQPIFDGGGNVIGSWTEGEDGECELVCAGGYMLAPDRSFCIPVEVQPEPEEFPPTDPCMDGIYTRVLIPTDGELYEAADPPTRAVLKDLRFHVHYEAQKALMFGILERISLEPSVRSVMARRVLEEMAPDCDWWVSAPSMLPSQRLVYEDALAMARAAEVEKKWEHPTQARKNMVPREYLGLPSTGVLNLAPGQAVELLVVEGPQMRHGEHLVAKTLQGGPNPRVEVVGTFLGADVSPRFGASHGFKVGTQVVLESAPPTSVYRVYPKDWN